MSTWINFLIHNCILVLLLYPLAIVQMFHQAEFGDVPYAANGGREVEIGMSNPAAAHITVQNESIDVKDSPPPSYENTKI